jgi:hypothetical protein
MTAPTFDRVQAIETLICMRDRLDELWQTIHEAMQPWPAELSEPRFREALEREQAAHRAACAEHVLDLLSSVRMLERDIERAPSAAPAEPAAAQ